MARLIEKSEKTMGWAPARGWEDGELEKVRKDQSGRYWKDAEESNTMCLCMFGCS